MRWVSLTPALTNTCPSAFIAGSASCWPGVVSANRYIRIFGTPCDPPGADIVMPHRVLLQFKGISVPAIILWSATTGAPRIAVRTAKFNSGLSG